MLAGSRQLRGSGTVHCIDPFDASGDSFSAPIYRDILRQNGGGDMLAHVLALLDTTALTDYTRIYRGLAEDCISSWHSPIDMLILDGDQSRVGARRAFDDWFPSMRSGGMLVLGNSADRVYEPDHDGNAEVLKQCVASTKFSSIERGDTSFLSVK